MKGHIRRRGSRSWAVVLDVDSSADGKRRQKWHSVSGTRKDAERELARLLHEMNTGSYVEPTKLTVREFLERWLNDYAVANVSGKTLERYSSIIRHHLAPALGMHVLNKLAPLHIQRYYTEALRLGRKDGRDGGLSPQTVLHHHRVLHKALGQAVRWQLITRNPADAVEPPRPEPKEIAAIDEDTAAMFIKAAAGTRLYLPILLALTTGMRRGEILALRWSDIELESGVVHVRRSLEETRVTLRFKDTKTRRGRRPVDLPALSVAALIAHRDRQALELEALGRAFDADGLVCASPGGDIWRPSAFTSAYRALLRRRKLPSVNFHALRHSHASQLLKNDVNPKVISERLGQSRVAFTLDTYSHLLPGIQRRAAASIDAAVGAALRKLKRTRTEQTRRARFAKCLQTAR